MIRTIGKFIIMCNILDNVRQMLGTVEIYIIPVFNIDNVREVIRTIENKLFCCSKPNKILSLKCT